MTFKIDENLPADVATLLRASGFAADTVRDQGLSGACDEVVAAAVRREDRVLITLDLDFGNIYAYPPEDYSGISSCVSGTRTSAPCWPCCSAPSGY